MSLIDNQSQWLDTAGAPLDCHEGMVLRVGDGWYWYGRRYRGNDSGVYGEAGAAFRCPIVVCRSDDLATWSPAQIAVDYPADGPWTAGTLHRPRVAFNARTQLYVMWFFHLTVKPIPQATALVATSPTPEGPFEIIGPATTTGYVHSGDHDLFVDDDGRAWLAAGDWDRNALIAPLADDFAGTTAPPRVVLPAGPDARYEGYALTRSGRHYLYAASGVQGLGASETHYAIADNPLGPWTPMGAMSRERTWGCQISSLLHIPETGVLVALCDRWLNDHAGRPTREALHSAQQWYPVSVDAASGRARMLPLPCWNTSLDIEGLERVSDELAA